MKTRCKLTVTEVAERMPVIRHMPVYGKDGVVTGYHQEESSRRQRVKFHAVYDDTIPDDVRFQLATPTGKMSLDIDNPQILDGFKPGESYYVDLTPCEE